MDLREPLSDIFKSPGHIAVLRALFRVPEGYSASTRDFSRRASISHPSAGRALSSLLEQGVVQVHRTAHADLYQLCPTSVALPALRALFSWEAELGADFERALQIGLSSIDGVIDATGFGSSFDRATLGQGPPGDIDVAITFRPSAEQAVMDDLAALADDLRDRYGVRLDFLTRASNRTSRAPVWTTIRATGTPIITDGAQA